MVKTSTLISIIYFSANIILLILLAWYVKKKGEYESIKSRAFLKDVWSQRKIYAPLIIHFYDTATDIGVVYYWYTLMIDEQENDIDYISVNMTVFFWCGIAFLLVYRLLTLIIVIIGASCADEDDSPEWYDLIFVFLDIYIFRMVYESFKTANETLQKNAQKRRKKNEAKKQKQQQQHTEIEMEPAATKESTIDDIDAERATVIEDGIADDDDEIITIEPHEAQSVIQLLESVTESMPQIMLQSVFVIRSYNEPLLAQGDIWLISFSILASLVSISNKIVNEDASSFEHESKSLSPKLQFPKCVSYLYILRVIWRLSDIMSKFAIYVLMWVVVGGAWLGIWVGFTFLLWFIYLFVIFGNKLIDNFIKSFVALAAVSLAVNPDSQHLLKFIESCIGLTLIVIFGTLDFECSICAPMDERQFSNEYDNPRILRFFIIACIATFLEPMLYTILRCTKMIDAYME